MRLLSAFALVALTLAGCTSDAPLPAAPEAATDPLPDPWMGEDSLPIAHREIGEGDIQEFDVVCVFGGTAFLELPRDGPIPNGTAALAFHVASGMMTTATQAGYAVSLDSRDAGAITWLPAVSNGEDTFRVQVLPEESEAAGAHWTFHYQINLPEPLTQDCYTGFSQGGYAVHVAAVNA